MAEETDIVDQQDTETQDGGPKPKPKPALPGLEKSGGKPPLPGLSPEKKNDVVTTTGAGEVGGKAGAVPSNGQSNSTGDDKYAPYVFDNKPVQDNTFLGGVKKQQQAQTTQNKKDTDYIQNVRPLEIQRKAKELKEQPVSTEPSFDGIDFIQKDIANYGGGESLKNAPVSFELVNNYFGNDATNSTNYFTHRKDAIDKQIEDLRQNKSDLEQKRLAENPVQGDIGSRGTQKLNVDPLTGKPVKPTDYSTDEEKSTVTEINELQDYKNKLIRAQSSIAKRYAAMVAPTGSLTEKGKLYGKFMGDENAAQQQAYEDKGIPVTQQSKYETDMRGVEVLAQQLNDSYAGKEKDDDYYEKLAYLGNLGEGILNKYPEFKKQQGANLIAQLASKDEKLKKLAQTGHGDLSTDLIDYISKTYNISKDDLKGIEYGDIPDESAVSNVFKGVYNAATSLVAGGTRILGTAIGADPDRLTYINEGITGSGNKIFGDNPYAHLLQSETLVDKNLQTISNPRAGKYNYNAATITNAIGDGIGGLLGFVLGTKGVGTAAKLTDDAAMTAYMVGSGFEPNYQRANDVMGKDAPEFSKGLYAAGMGYLEALAFKVLPKDKIFFGSAETKAAQKELANSLSGMSVDKINREVIEKGYTKVLKAALNTTEETAKVGGAMTIAEMAKTATNVLLGDDKNSARYIDEGVQNVGNLVKDLAFSMGLPLGVMEIPKHFSHSARFKQTLFDAGDNPETHTALINQAKDKGLISQDEVNKQMQVVNTMRDIVASTPDVSPVTNKPLTQSQQVDYAYSKVKEIAFKIKAEGVKGDPELSNLYLSKAKELADERMRILAEDKSVEKTEQPEEKTFTDFDKTLFHEGKLTDLGKEMKDRIAKGEDITILTSRKDTPENRKFISETLGIPESSIKMGLDAEGKAAELTAHTGKKVFYDDNPENVKAAQQTDARVVNTGLSSEQQIVMDNAKDIKSKLYKNIIEADPTAENADNVLKAVSDQWYDEGTRDVAERDFPEPIIEAAKKLYPQESAESLVNKLPTEQQSGKDVSKLLDEKANEIAMAMFPEVGDKAYNERNRKEVVKNPIEEVEQMINYYETKDIPEKEKNNSSLLENSKASLEKLKKLRDEYKSLQTESEKQQSGKDGKVAPDAELGIQQGYAKKAMTDFINSPDMGYSIHEEGGKTALGLSEAQVRSANGLKGGDRMQSHEHTNIELTKDEKKQLNKIESDKELGDIDGLEYAKQKRALAKKIFERASNELQQKANEQSGKDVVVDEGVVGDKKFVTHNKEVVTGKKLTDAVNKVADDMVESAKKKREEYYASHVTEKQKDDILKKDIEYANEVRDGKHLDNLTIAQRINYELTGETVPLLPKENATKPEIKNEKAEAVPPHTEQQSGKDVVVDDKQAASKAKSKLAAFKEKHKPESTELTPAENKEWNGLSMAEKLKLAKENLPEVEKLSDTEAAKVADERAKELLAAKNKEPEETVDKPTPQDQKIIDAHNEIDGYINEAQNAYDKAQAERLAYIKENGYPAGGDADFDKLVIATRNAEDRFNQLKKAKDNLLPLPETKIINEKINENEQPTIAADRNENALAAEKLVPEDNPIAEPDVKAIEGAAENPGGIESKELYAADQSATALKNAATGVVNVPIADISTNEGEYQGRKNKFSERSANNVAENYDQNKLDPIVLYKHPDGKTYVLSGHSRFEGMTRRGEKTIPARYFEGTPEEAKDFALKSNKLGTLQTDIENAAHYRGKLKSGESYNSLMADAKENEQEGSAKRIVSLAHLNPDGKAMQALEALEKGEGDTKNNILNIAQKIGDIRAKNEHLTDAHENELFDHMVADKKNIPTDKDIANQNNTLNRSINHAKFSPEEPLNLDKVVNKSDNRIQWEKEKSELEQQQSDLKKQVNPSKQTGWTGLKEKAVASLTNGDKSHDAIDKAVKDFESNKDGIKDAYQKQLEQKRAELNSVNDKLAKHLLREKDLIEGDKNQQSLFAVQGNTPEQVSDMKDIVKDLVDEGNTNLTDIQKIVAKELGNNSEEMKGLVEEAFHEYGKDAENTPKEVTGGVIGKVGQFLSKLFGGTAASRIVIAKDSESLIKKAESLGGKGAVFMKTPEGTVLGFTDPSTGKIYLNGEHLNPGTTLHESGHLWTEWTKQNDPAVYSRGIELTSGSRYLDNVKANEFYKAEAAKLPKDQREQYFQHEALAMAIGDKGAQFVTEAKKTGFKEWLNNLWTKIKDAAGFKDITPKELSNLTLGEFASRAAKDILNSENENSKADTKSNEPVKAEEKPSTETEPTENSDTAAEGETDENGVRISKAGLKAQSNFSKDFDRRGGQEVADGVMATLQRRADAKGITVQEQAAHEVSQMKGRSVEPTEHNIITAGTHLLDLTNQLKKAVENNDIAAIEGITELRNEANAVLRQLGNNAGRNLGLFNLVMHDADNGELSVIRANVKNQLGVEDFPETIEALKKSNLTSGDKKKIEPYVAKYEQIVKERDGYIDKDGNRVPGYIEKSMKAVSALEDADVQKAIQEAHEAGKKEGMVIAKDKPTREKKSQQLRDIASRLRTSDEMDKFLNRAGGFTDFKSGIDLGSYKEIIANIIDGVANITEGAEKVGDFIKNAIDKVQGVDKDKLLRDVQTIISRASLPDKAETIADINKIAENENAQTITKTMVEKGLIKNVVDDVIHSDVPYDKVIETATEELKQHLPNVTKADVADAYVRRNEFAPEKKSALENTVRTKSEDVKRITNKEHRLAALEAGEDYHNAETKEAKQKVRSDYEQSVDSRIKELEKQKSDTENQLKEPKTHSDRLQEAKDAVQDRIDRIRTEIADRERVVGKEKLPLHEDVELGRLKDVEKALTSLRDKYLPEQPKMFADEKALKKRRVDLTNDISELNDQINKGERKEKKESTLEDTEHIKTLREIKKAKQELLDKVAPDYDKLKKQADKETAELKKKIADIEAEKKYVNDNKKVFERAIVTPHVVNDLLKAAREERDKTYAENGLRVQKNGREPIRIEREYQKSVDETTNSNLLTESEKQDKLAELKQQRDLDLQGTHQGVLSHLADDVQDLKKENVESANNSDPATAQKLNDLNKKLDSITEGLQPTGENLEDMATKAYGKINDLLADKDVPKDVKEKLQQIKKDFENNNQLTADQLANKAIKKQWEREIKTAQTKINSGNFTELPTTPFDFRRSIELSNLDRQRQNTTKQLNNLQVEAREKNKTMLDKIMDFSTKLLVSGAHTVLKVAEAGAFKPVMDTVVESTTGRVFNKLTNTPKTTLAEIKQATRQYYAFKNKAAAEAHIVKLQDAKLAALDNLDKAIKGGNEAEIKKAENAFKKADLTYGISTLYHSIDANSLKTFWEYVAHGATDLDEQVGKGLKKDISDYRTKLGKAGYVLDGWVRTHGALKTSLSARNEIVRSYASTLKYMQDKGMELNEQNLALAHLIAVNDFEYGRLSNKTAFSTLISKGKTHKSQAVRAVVKTLAPVSTIAINITKRGIDYSTLGAEGWVKLANAVKEGNRINEVEGKVYDTWMQKYADGIKQIPLQERKYINGVISRGLFGAGLSLATLYGLSTGNIKYGGTYDDKNKRKVYGADGELLQPNEWEFWGWKAPKLVEHFINHLPEMLPLALTSDIYEINQLDKKPAYLKTIFGEVQNRMPFMTLLGLINRPAETLVDRFTRVPLASEIEKGLDDKDRENKTIGQKLKNNFGLGFLNPEKGANGYDVSQDHFKALKGLGINAPTSKEIDQYKIEEDAAHPTGQMTKEEGEAFKNERTKLVDEGLKKLYEKGIKLQRKDFGILRIDLKESKDDILKKLESNNITWEDFDEQLKNKKKAIVSEATKKAKKAAVPNQIKTNQMTSTIPDY